MSLMGSLYIGQSGLQTSQNALHTVTHNLSNIDTTGYTRQQVVQADKTYHRVGEAYISYQQTGLGVSYAQVRQVRDYFLDRTYRIENGRTAYYDESYNVAVELDTLFGEMEGVEFREALSDLWTACEELQKSPADATNQGMFVSKCATFLERAQAVYNGLSSYQDILNTQIRDTVDTINDYGNKILELNRKIKAIEAGQIEKANDLRDARNQLIDELAAFGKVTVEEDPDGAVTVQFEDKDFVTRKYMNPMEAQLDDTTGFYDVVWANDSDVKGNKIPVFNLEREINSDMNTDVGSLKAMLLLRGSDRGYYTDIPTQPNMNDEKYNPGGVFDSAAYAADMDTYTAEVEVYNKTVNKSLLQNTMAEFDKLIHGIVTAFNDLLNPVLQDAGGNDYMGGISVFLRQGTLDAEKTTEMQTPVEDEFPGTDINSDGTVDEKDEKEWKSGAKTTWYTTANLKINPLLLQQYNQLGSLSRDEVGSSYTKGFMTVDNKENREMADALLGLFTQDFSTLNPNAETPSNYSEYYSNLIGEAAGIGYAYKVTSQTQAMTLESVEASRQQVVGVSDNEELNNMIMYQNAYNASSRYINAINEMLSHLIQTLGT